MSFTIKCPSCDETLNKDARQCACGWKNPRFEAQPSAKEAPKDRQCTYTHAGMRCKHPVGYYEQGAQSGWCIFHRASTSQETGRDIVIDSEKFSAREYETAAKAKTYGNGDSFEVAKIRAGLRDKSYWPSAGIGLKEWLDK